MNAITKLSDLQEITKGHLTALSRELTNPIIDGDIDPVEGYLKIKAAYELLKMAVDNKMLKDTVIEAVNGYGAKDREKYGIKFNVKNLPDNWDLSGDYILNDLLQEKKVIDLKIKARQEYLKSAYHSDVKYVDPDTGEEIHVRSQIEYIGGAQTLMILFPK